MVDRLGFPTSQQPCEEQLLRDNARLEKWEGMLSRWDFELRSRKQRLKLRVRKGIPACLRAKVWWELSSAEVTRSSHPPELFTALRQLAFSEQIQKDAHRTFPTNVLFRERTGQNRLCQVLQAYAAFDPEVGYCQGMGALAALLLLFLDEERCFWLLATLMQKYELKGLYATGLSGLYRSLFIATRLLRQFVPKVHTHFQHLQLSPSLFLSKWLLSQFAQGFAPETSLRICDAFLLEGEKVWYRVVLAVLELAGKPLLSADLDEALLLIETTAETLAPDPLFRVAFRYHLSRKAIAALDAEYESAGRDQDYATW